MNICADAGQSDAELLASLESRLKLVRDRTRGVAKRFANGFYLWGEGGISKSYTVENTLNQLGKAYKVSNSRLTGKGLFELLLDFPDTIHILDDVETLFKDKNSFGVLRSAALGSGRQRWSPGAAGSCRQVTPGAARSSSSLVASSLSPTARSITFLELRASLGTRLSPLQHKPTNEEVAALMRQIAMRGQQNGPHVLPPDDCLEVAAEIISRSQRLERNLDLRLFVEAQCPIGCSGSTVTRNRTGWTFWSRVSRNARSPRPNDARAGMRKKAVSWQSPSESLTCRVLTGWPRGRTRLGKARRRSIGLWASCSGRGFFQFLSE